MYFCDGRNFRAKFRLSHFLTCCYGNMFDHDCTSLVFLGSAMVVYPCDIHKVSKLLIGKEGQLKKEVPSVAMMTNFGFGPVIVTHTQKKQIRLRMWVFLIKLNWIDKVFWRDFYVLLVLLLLLLLLLWLLLLLLLVVVVAFVVIVDVVLVTFVRIPMILCFN